MTKTTNSVPKQSFSQGIGQWLGAAEVYDGAGHFLGNAADRRHVQRQVDDEDTDGTSGSSVRIDLSFVGPFKFAGHYTIADRGDHRLYRGPANYGYAEALAPNLIDANAYWPVTGLSQRFFLMVLPNADNPADPDAPGNRQMSLALMSRGEQLIYVVVGEYERQEGEASGVPGLVNGTSFDLHDDPTAGRGTILLHRNGRWTGALATLDEALAPQESTRYSETVASTTEGLHVAWRGAAFAPGDYALDLRTNGRQAWSAPGDAVGSYSLSGGRALAGQIHLLDRSLRVWRREVVSHDGQRKAVLHTWYRGGARVGVQFGVLDFEAA